MELIINGTPRRVESEADTPLLWVIRDELGLTGTKKGCDHGQCGACTVLIDGHSANSCLTLAVMHEGSEITTVEGLARDGQLHPVQEAFLEHDAYQCGYCTAGLGPCVRYMEYHAMHLWASSRMSFLSSPLWLLA